MKKNDLEILLLIGIPASGKSTWSKEFVRKNANYVRVNRDMYRLMLKDAQVCEPKVEDLISGLVNQAIEASLMKKLNANIDCSDWSNKQFRYVDMRMLERQLIKYLKPFCADSFGVASHALQPSEEDDYKTKVALYVAFRSKKDLFKFNMKFGGLRRRWWRSHINFTVVATADDPYVFCSAGEKWNREDPHGYLRP